MFPQRIQVEEAQNQLIKPFIMKKFYFTTLLLLFVLSLQSCMVSRKPNMAFFDNPYYDFGNAQFTSVNVPVWLAKPFVKTALREEADSEELVALIKKVKKVNVLTVENGNQAMLKDFAAYLGKNNYEDWVTVKHDGQNVNIQALQEGDVIKKLMLLVQAEDELVFVDVKGKFTPEDISNLINLEQRAQERKDKKSLSKNQETQNELP